MSDAAIEVRALTKAYGRHVVVRDLSLVVGTGEIFGFLGPNGSGKSTTIKMLCGLVEPTSGDASICAIDVRTHGDAVRRLIGYMSQSFSLYGDLTVEENLEFYGRAYALPRVQRRRRIDELVAFSDLQPYRRQLAATLSGGWKQRLALAAALLHEPRVLFLDEPTAGIDPVARRDLWDLLFRLSETGVALFVTTHYMDEAERCTRIVYLNNGRIVIQGAPEAVVRDAGMVTYEATGPDPDAAARKLRQVPGIEAAAMFGSAVHIAGMDRAALQRATAAFDPAFKWHEVEPGLEDVFIHLLKQKDPA